MQKIYKIILFTLLNINNLISGKPNPTIINSTEKKGAEMIIAGCVENEIGKSMPDNAKDKEKNQLSETNKNQSITIERLTKQLEIKDDQIKEKDKKLEEKDKQLEKKDSVISKLTEALNNFSKQKNK